MSLPALPSPGTSPHPHPSRTYAILRLWALLKPAKEALRPTTPTAPASPEDRNRTLTDMAVTCRERTGQSAWRRHLVRADRGLATLHHGLRGPCNREGVASTVPSAQMRKPSLGEVREHSWEEQQERDSNPGLYSAQVLNA